MVTHHQLRRSRAASPALVLFSPLLLPGLALSPACHTCCPRSLRAHKRRGRYRPCFLRLAGSAVGSFITASMYSSGVFDIAACSGNVESGGSYLGQASDAGRPVCIRREPFRTAPSDRVNEIFIQHIDFANEAPLRFLLFRHFSVVTLPHVIADNVSPSALHVPLRFSWRGKPRTKAGRSPDRAARHHLSARRCDRRTLGSERQPRLVRCRTVRIADHAGR